MELYRRPANEFVAGFIGSPRMNFIDRPLEGGARGPHRDLWQQLAPGTGGDTHRVGIRPEHLDVTTPQEGVQATVELVEQLGDSIMVHVRVDGLANLVIAKVASGDRQISAGQTVGLKSDSPKSALAFDSKGLLLNAV
jgi:multiple sugar transport system ATP-binding protein